MVSAPYARKHRKKTIIAVRIKAYISKSILPIAWTVTYIYLYWTRRRTAPMARPANARTDTQTGGRTHRSTDGHTNGRTDTQKHERRRRSTDADAEAWMQTQKHGRRRADADARTQTQAPDSARTLNIRACSAWVEKSSRRVLRLDERTRTFEVYYI